MEITICEILFSSFIPIINIILFSFILLIWQIVLIWILPSGSDSKESVCSMGDPGSIPGLGRFPGEGSSNPLQYSCLENSMDRGALWAIVLGVTKSQTELSDWHLHFFSLSAYKFRNFTSFWWIKPFDIMNCSPFSLEELFFFPKDCFIYY